MALGLCSNPHCANHYCADPLLASTVVVAARAGSSENPSARHGGEPAQESSREPLLRLLDPSLREASWEMNELAFVRVGLRYASSQCQVSQPLAVFIDQLFRQVSCQYTVALETLVRALRMLELLQVEHIRRHHLRPRDVIGPASVDEPWGLHRANQRSVAAEPVLRSPPSPGSSLGVRRVTPVTRCHAGEGFSESRSSCSCSSVGPHTDDEVGYAHAPLCSSATADDKQLPSAVCQAASSSPTVPYPPHPHHLPHPLTLSKRCSVCQSLDSFALQYDNVQLMLTACLALSVSINEEAVVESTSPPSQKKI